MGADSSAARVRRATPSDIPALGRLGAMLVETHHALDRLRFIPVAPQTSGRYGAFLGTQLSKADVVVLVAEREGAVVGYAYAGLEDYDYMALRGPAGALYDLAVDSSHRRRGIGRLLLEAALGELGAKGAPRVVLSTAQGNEAAQALFATAAFRRTMVEMTRELG